MKKKQRERERLYNAKVTGQFCHPPHTVHRTNQTARNFVVAADGHQNIQYMQARAGEKMETVDSLSTRV